MSCVSALDGMLQPFSTLPSLRLHGDQLRRSFVLLGFMSSGDSAIF